MFFKRSRSPRTDSSQPVPRHRKPQLDEDVSDSSTTPQFRRNQTLSSYRRTGTEALNDSERQKAHHLASQRRRLGGVFLVVLAVVVGLVLLLWQLIAQVHVVTSTKQLTTSFDGSAYEKIINDYLNVNPSQRLRFALNEDSLSAFVSSNAPEVENVQLSGWAGVAQSNIAITFRAPVAGWQINGKQYYVDASGVVFEKNYYETPTVQIVDESGITPDQQGGAVVGTRLLGFLGKVVAQAKGRGYTPVKAVLPEGTTRQVDVSFDGIPTRVKFSIDRGAGEQMEDADRAMKHLQSRGVAAQYIDVRVSGRAAYK